MDSSNRVQPCDRPSCDFRSDPDNSYRYVCLQCSLKRSTKKQDPPLKQFGIEQTLIWTILIVIGWLLWAGVDGDQPSVPPPAQPITTN